MAWSDSPSEGWKLKHKFDTGYLQATPFALSHLKIIYCTRYVINKKETSGIFQYDIANNKHKTIKLWDDIGYYPRWNTMINTQTKNMVIFAGGANVTNNHKNYQLILFYDLETNSIKEINIERVIGSNGKLAITHNDNYLHIIGGEENSEHILYNIKTNKSKIIHSFIDTNPYIMEHELLYNKSTNILMMFGGFNLMNDKLFADFWMLDLNKTTSLLSLNELSQYLVFGYVKKTFLEQKNHYNYDIGINDIIQNYLGDNNDYSQWELHDEFKLPTKIRAFGSVLYDDRIIILCGGVQDQMEMMNSIYFLDLNSNDGWILSELTTPESGACHALLIEKTVHILPYSCYQQHHFIDIASILPSTLL